MSKTTKKYTIELDFNEIHLLLHSLDEFLENNRDNLPEKTFDSVAGKLESLHWNHIKTQREERAKRARQKEKKQE